MAAQPRLGLEIPHNFRFEFDSANKILLLRWEGRLTDDSLAGVKPAPRKYWAATDARAGIEDFSSVTEFAVSAEFVRWRAGQEPAMPDATRPLFIVVPATVGFGLARMYQILGERTQLVHVVRTMDEALAALGVASLHFEPLE
jgi:hypothetical protein